MCNDIVRRAWREFTSGKTFAQIIDEQEWDISAVDLRREIIKQYGERKVRKTRQDKRLLFLSREIDSVEFDKQNLSDEEISSVIDRLNGVIGRIS